MKKVMFLGGELDGQVKTLPDLPSVYRAPCFSRKVQSFLPEGQDFTPGTQPEVMYTEYVLIKQVGVFFYIERELLRLSNEEASQQLCFYNPLSAHIHDLLNGNTGGVV